MNVLIINSSYRKNSNSAILADKTAQGAREAGATVQVEDIGRLHIHNCRGCYGCMSPNADFCVEKDEMQRFYPLILEADAVVFAGPIYWFNICGQLKQFVDRMFAVAVRQEGGKSVLASKKFAALFAFEDVDALASGCVNAVRMFQDMSRYVGVEWAGTVYASANLAGAMAENTTALENAYALGKSLV